MISVDQLSVSFDTQKVLTNIGMNIEKGKFYCIAGPNGSGKTTFLRTLIKSLPVKQGLVFIKQQNISDLSEKKLARMQACVSQNHGMESEHSCFDMVMLGRSPYQRPLQFNSLNDIRIVKDAMEITHTWHLKDRTVRTLSGGEKQRVMIARALAQQTEILLLDEPVSNLDIRHQLEILNLLKKLNTEKGLTVVAVLHDLNHIISYANEVILFHNGKLIANGNPEKVLTQENIQKVFAVDASFIDNPKTGKKVLVTVGLN